MGDLPHYFDIILFAMVAAFLVLRLRSVLGRRTGQERPHDPMLRRAEAPGEKLGDKGVAPGGRNAAGPPPPGGRGAGTKGLPGGAATRRCTRRSARGRRRMPSRPGWSASSAPIRA